MMKVDFDSLRQHIVHDYNKLIKTLNNMEDDLDEYNKADLSDAFRKLHNSLWPLMCVYLEEDGKNFWETVKLRDLSWDKDDECDSE